MPPLVGGTAEVARVVDGDHALAVDAEQHHGVHLRLIADHELDLVARVQLLAVDAEAGLAAVAHEEADVALALEADLAVSRRSCRQGRRHRRRLGSVVLTASCTRAAAAPAGERHAAELEAEGLELGEHARRRPAASSSIRAAKRSKGIDA